LLSLLVVRADEHSCNGDRLACGGSLVYNHYAQTPGSYNATPTNGAYGPGSASAGRRQHRGKQQED